MSRSVRINSLFLLLGCLLLMVACAPTGIYHTVQPGQTLYRIAKTYEIDEDRLANINNVKDPKQLKANQKLFIPNVTQVRKVPATATGSGRTASHRVPSASSRSSSKPAKVTRKPVTSKPAATAPDRVTKATKGLFTWPVKGKILNKFGKQGQKVYKGIEIGVPKGTAVIAAASGKVIYSGNAIPGYGNLVILEHSDSYFSVYGFNQKTLVKMDDHVGQGERIALSGLPPSGQSARLHFEIRKGKSAVNPILYLP
jgi:lipoprotein NlpD